MFRLSRPAEFEIQAAITAVSSLPADSPRFLAAEGGLTVSQIPMGHAHDCASLEIGKGPERFATAQKAFVAWAQFDLGWTHVANPDARIVAGQLVAVQVRTLGLWSLNLSRIVDVVDTATQFGYVYATTRMHAEQGEERFLLELDSATGSVTYRLEAISRPRNFFARLGYPYTRATQHRFARESLQRVWDEVRKG